MKGIIPIKKVSQPRPLTLEFMINRVSQREIAQGCLRCGGTGRFSTVAFAGIGSKYGAHCFNCGDAWKVPLEWSKFTAIDVMNLFLCSEQYYPPSLTLERFVKTKLLKKDVAELVRILIYLNKHGLKVSLEQAKKMQNVVEGKTDGEIKNLLKTMIIKYRKDSLKTNLLTKTENS